MLWLNFENTLSIYIYILSGYHFMNDSIFAVYKPKGISSAKFLDKLKHYLNSDHKTIKIGHAGTLDPNASGILVVGTGKCTKQLNKYILCDKTYIATILLGYVSSTYDDKGTKSFVSDIRPNNKIITETLNKFIGLIDQIPPKYSAIHINGERAYKLARDSKDFVIPSRKITIHEINLLEYEHPILKIKVKCSSGTYIRSLAYDIGNILECGGYLKDLERISIGGFEIKDCLDLLNILQ